MKLTHEMLDAKNPYNIQMSDIGNGETQDDKEFMDLSDRVFQCDKGDRPTVLLYLQENEPIKTLHSDLLTLDVWQSVEFPCKQLDTWEQIWSNYLGLWQEEKLKSVFSNGAITVYRGGPEKGYSWTTNKDVALWFSLARGCMSRLRTEETGVTVDIGLWKRTVTKDDVVAMCSHEDEVILTEECAFHTKAERLKT